MCRLHVCVCVPSYELEGSRDIIGLSIEYLHQYFLDQSASSNSHYGVMLVQLSLLVRHLPLASFNEEEYPEGFRLSDGKQPVRRQCVAIWDHSPSAPHPLYLASVLIVV